MTGPRETSDRDLARFAAGGSGGVTDRSDTIWQVPTISRFFGITISMFHDDHGRPHFHPRHADGSARIRIDEIDRSIAAWGDGNYVWCSRGRSFTSRS